MDHDLLITFTLLAKLKNFTKTACLTAPFQDWFYSIFPRNYVYPLDINISINIINFLKEGIGLKADRQVSIAIY